ncbi:hypothetical protein [Nocardia sp. NPDC058497]|uniref:hypothetical protein n=1 Tax=Nocardia sp. NPDC058497 TaxID=3346529 RepID=UPI0036460617
MDLETFTTALPIAAALVASTVSGVAETTPRIEPIAAQTCSAEFYNGLPYVQHDAVIGGVTVTCPKRPNRFHLSVTVEYKVRGGSGWIVGGADATDLVPDPAVTLAAYAPCQPAAGKTVANMWEDSNGSSKTYTAESATLITSC